MEYFDDNSLKEMLLVVFSYTREIQNLKNERGKFSPNFTNKHVIPDY